MLFASVPANKSNHPSRHRCLIITLGHVRVCICVYTHTRAQQLHKNVRKEGGGYFDAQKKTYGISVHSIAEESPKTGHRFSVTSLRLRHLTPARNYQGRINARPPAGLASPAGNTRHGRMIIIYTVAVAAVCAAAAAILAG